VLVVITALAFDFTNGFHDTGNAMATSIATGALPPRVAVALSGLLNLVGAFLSLAVAATIASGLVDTAEVTLQVVAAGLAGGIIWNLLTWLFGIPSSSSHALIGGVIGSTLAAAGGSAVLWKGLVSKVVIPAALSPIIAAGSPRSAPGCSTGSAAASPPGAVTTASGSGRSARPPWCPWRTARTTRRRRWASSRWP
jgi:PiT family inorganic phosphate transporter